MAAKYIGGGSGAGVSQFIRGRSVASVALMGPQPTYDQQQGAAFALTHLESMCNLDIDSQPSADASTSSIICTIGPACR